MPQRATIFDDITETDWKAPRKSVFDDLKPEDWQEPPKYSIGRNISQVARAGIQGLADVTRGARGLESMAGYKPSSPVPIGGELANIRARAQQYAKQDPFTEVRNLAISELKPVEEYAPEMLPGVPAGFGGMVEQATSGMARFAPSMVTSAISAPAGLASTFAQIFGMERDKYLKKGVDEERANVSAMVSALGQTPIEFAGNLLQIGALKNIAKGITRPVARRLANFGQALLKGAIGEGGEEYFQKYPEVIADVYASNPGKKPKELAKIAIGKVANLEFQKEAGYEALIGALGGGMLAGAGGIIGETARPFVGKGEAAKPTLTKEQILNGLKSGMPIEKANEIKYEYPELAEAVDSAIDEFQQQGPATPRPKEELPQQMPQPKSAEESAQVFEEAGPGRAEQAYNVFEEADLVGDPVEIARRRNQTIMDSVDLDILAEAEEREKSKKLEVENARGTGTSIERSGEQIGEAAEAQTEERPVVEGGEERVRVRNVEKPGMETEPGETLKPKIQKAIITPKEPWQMTKNEFLKSETKPIDDHKVEISAVKRGDKPAFYGESVDQTTLDTAKSEGLNIEQGGRGNDWIITPNTESGKQTASQLKDLISESKKDPELLKDKDWHYKFSKLLGYDEELARSIRSKVHPAALEKKRLHELYIEDAINRGEITSRPQKSINDLGKSGRRQLAGAYGEVGEVDTRSDEEREAQGERRKIDIPKLKDTLKNEKGSSQLYTDIINHGIQLKNKGTKTLRKFRVAMKEKFAHVWEKIRPHIRTLWNILNSESGQVDVWHGSPHRFEKFSTEKIGTGEGAQSFGWGLYFTDQKSIAEKYAKKLGVSGYADAEGVASRILDATNGNVDDALAEIARRRKIANIPGSKDHFDAIEAIIKEGSAPRPNIYKATLFKGKTPMEYRWLDWDKPLTKENAIKYANALKSKFPEYDIDKVVDNITSSNRTGKEIYESFARKLGSKKEASLLMSKKGIDGIRYPAGTLSGGGKGTNYVVFDENAVTIKEINGKLLDALKNEKGSSQLVNDISAFGAEQIRKGVKTFQEFRAVMKERFADIWDKIKAHIKELWDVLRNQRGAINLERTESVDDLIAKLQKTEPKKEVQKHEFGDGWYSKLSAFERLINDLTAWLADKNHPISVIQKRLKNVREQVDVFLRETQRPKVTAAKIDRMWIDEVEPLLRDMAESDITLGDLEEYSHAVHAPEANAKLSDAMAKIYLDDILNILPKKQTLELRSEISQLKNMRKTIGLGPQDYRGFLDKAFNNFTDERVKNIKAQWEDFIEKPSGMTDEEAAAIKTKWKGNADIERLRQALRSINDNRLDLLYDSGLIAKEEYEAIKAKYKDYVPLYREGYDDSLFGPSRGLRPAGRPVKTRMGSKRDVVNILANTIANYEKAINLSEKARSTEALKNLVLDNPDPTLWHLKKEKKSPRHDDYGNIRMYPDLFNIARNEMRFMVGGKQWFLEVNKDNKDAMNMLKTLKAEDSMHGWFLNQLARLNRFLARVNTSWSPEFVVSNFARDLQTAGINIQDTGVKGKSMIQGALKAANAIWHVERGKQQGTDLESLYERFKEAGGKIGWADVHQSVGNLSKKLAQEIETLAGKRPTRKAIKQFGDFVEAANTSIENGIRLHAFKLATEQGFSDSRAAQIASDLTVDFTKKGYAGPAINSLYLFANAGIQGSYRIIRAATKNSKVRKTMVAIMGIGFLNGLLNSMAGDDEDNEDYFNKIEDYIKERNAIFMIPGTKGKYVKIPLPWGYNLPWAVGVEVSKAFTQKNYKPMEGAFRLGSTFVNAFNPIQSGTLLQTLAPTVADPFVQVAENKNWYGGPLMPDKNTFEKVPNPDSQRYWKSSRAISRGIAQGINAATGGDKVKPGLIDISPETLDLIVDNFGGAASRFFTDSLGLPVSWMRGEGTQIKQYPFIRRVFGEQSEYVSSQAYFKNVQDILTAEKQLETYRGTPYFKNLMASTTHQRKMFGRVKAAESALRRLRKMKRSAEAKNNNERIERIDKRIEAIYLQFNRAYNQD